MMLNKFDKLSISTGLILIAPASVFAASGSDGGHGSGPSALIPYWVNFLIYAGGMAFLVRKFLPAAWAERRARIVASVNAARSAYEAAERSAREARQKLERVAQEETRVRDDIAQQAEFEVRQVLDGARAKASRILEQAKETAAANRRQALRRLQDEVLASAFASAEGELKALTQQGADAKLREAAVAAATGLVN
jgi:F0F1-type ATP synthase membrane subunit b/b'